MWRKVMRWGHVVLMWHVFVVAASLWHEEAAAQCAAPTAGQDLPSLIAEIKTWRDEPEWAHNPAHAAKWNKVLASLGYGTSESPMPVSEIHAKARQWPDSRWAKPSAYFAWREAQEAYEECVAAQPEPPGDSTPQEVPETGTPPVGYETGTGGVGVGEGQSACAAPASNVEITVPVEWQAKPPAVKAGEKFRLVFLTTTTTNAVSACVTDYDGKVQHNAGSSSSLVRDHASKFKALISTSGVDAIAHLAMTGAGSGIKTYWVGGAKVADSYTDFWDRSWDSEAARDAGGRLVSVTTDKRPWTGTAGGNGRKAATHHAGNSGPQVVIGDLDGRLGNPIDAVSVNDKTDLRYLYGVSPVFKVEKVVSTSPSAIPTVNVPHDWALKPSAVQSGQKFRLLFVTKGTRSAAGKTAASYDTFVQGEAGQSSLIKDYSAHYRAIVSTSGAHAIDHAGMTGAGVPVYWVEGAKVADSYPDFWDGDWDSYEVRDRDGETLSSRRVWTGSTTGGRRSGRFYLGTSASFVVYGQGRTSPVYDSNERKTTAYAFYGISPIFKVGSPPATPASVPSLTISESSASPPGAPESDPTRIVTVTASKTYAGDVTFTYTVTRAGDSRTHTGVLAAGQATTDISIPVSDDSTDEPDRTTRVQLQPGTAYQVGLSGTVDLAIRDDDPTVVSLARVGSGFIREGGTAEFSVTLGRALVEGEIIGVPLAISGTGVTTADWSLQARGAGVSLSGGNTATPWVGFSGTGARTASLTLTAEVDSTNEISETWMVALGPDGTGTNGFDRSALGTNVGGGADPHGTDRSFNVEVKEPIPADIKSKITFERDEYVVWEGDRADVRICSTHSQSIRIQIATVGNTATAGTFTPGDSTRNPPVPDSFTGDFQGFEDLDITLPGTSSKTCVTHSIRTFQDTLYENGDWPEGEDFTVVISSIDNDTQVGGTSTTVTVADDEYTACFSSKTYLKRESDGIVSIPLDLSRVLRKDITVTAAFVDYLATRGVDYKVIKGTHTFKAGSKAGDFKIQIVDDKLDEPNELFRIAANTPQIGTKTAFDETVPVYEVPDGEVVCSTDVIIQDNDFAEIPIIHGMIKDDDDTVNEGETFTVEVSAEGKLKEDTPVRVYLHDESRVYIQGDLLREVVLSAGPPRPATIEIPTVKSDKPSASDKVWVYVLGADRGKPPYFVKSGARFAVTVNEVDDASTPFVTLHIRDETVDEGGTLNIDVSAWSKVTDPAFCRQYWGTGHYSDDTKPCFVEGANKALSVNVEIDGGIDKDGEKVRSDTRLPFVGGEYQETYRYVVDIPRTGFNSRLTRQTLKLKLRNDAIVNANATPVRARIRNGTGYTLVGSGDDAHPVHSAEDSITIVDDEKALLSENPGIIRINGYSVVGNVFSDHPTVSEDQAFLVCVNASRALNVNEGVDFHFTASTKGPPPGAVFYFNRTGGGVRVGDPPKELAGGTIHVPPGSYFSRQCGLQTFKGDSGNRDPEVVVHFDLDTTRLPPEYVVEKPRVTFTIEDAQPEPTWSVTHEGASPLSLDEDGDTGDFTISLSEPLDANEVYDMVFYAEKPQYTFSLSPDSPSGASLLTREEAGVDYPPRSGLGKIVRFKGAGAQSAILRVTGVHTAYKVYVPNPDFDSTQEESTTNPRTVPVHASVSGIVYPSSVTGIYISGTQPVWYTASDFQGVVKQNFLIVDIDNTDMVDIGWINEHVNVPEHNGPAQSVIKLSRSLQNDIIVHLRHASIGSTEGLDWRVGTPVNNDRYLGRIVVPAGRTRATYDVIIVKNDNIAEDPEAFSVEIESITPDTEILAKASRTFAQRTTVHILDHQAVDKGRTFTCPARLIPDGEQEATLECTITWNEPIASNRELTLRATKPRGAGGGKLSQIVTFAAGETTKAFSFTIPYIASDFSRYIPIGLSGAALYDTSTDPKSRVYGQELHVYASSINGHWSRTKYLGGESILKVADVVTREGAFIELDATIEPWPTDTESIKLRYSTRYRELDENGQPHEGYASPGDFHHYANELVTCVESGCSLIVSARTDSDDNEEREKFYVDVSTDSSVPAAIQERIDTVTATVTIEGSDLEPVKYRITSVTGDYPVRIREDGGTGDFTVQLSRPLAADEVHELHFTPEPGHYSYSLAPDNPESVSLERVNASCRGRAIGTILRFEGKGAQKAVMRVTGVRTSHMVSNLLFDSTKPESAENPKKVHGGRGVEILFPQCVTPIPYLKRLGPPQNHLSFGANYRYGDVTYNFVIVDIDNARPLDMGWSLDGYIVNENNAPAQPVLVLSRPLLEDTTVRIVHAEATASRGTGQDWFVDPDRLVDGSNDPYLAEVLIPEGVTRVTYDIRIEDDTIAENDETFTITVDAISPTPEHGLVEAADRRLPQTATVKILDNEKWTSEITCPGEYVIGTRSHNPTYIFASTGQGCELSLSNPVPTNHTLEVKFKAEIGSGDLYKVLISPAFSATAGGTRVYLPKNFPFQNFDAIHASLIGEDIRISIESATLTDTSTMPSRVFALGSTIYQMHHALVRVQLREDDPPPVPAQQLLSAQDTEVREGQVAEIRAVIDPWPEGFDPDEGVRLVYSTRHAEPDREGNSPPGKAGPHDYHAHWSTPIDCIAVEAGRKGCVIRIDTIRDSHDEGREDFYVDIGPDPSLPEPVKSRLGEVTATITIVNDGPMPSAWLVRFGRTAAQQAIDGVSDRMAAPRDAGVQGTFAGHSLAQLLGPADPAAPERAFDPSSQSMTARELLLGSSFTWTGEDTEGGSLAFWGRAAQGGFTGTEGTLSLEGDVTTGMLGADYARDRWLAGMALMQSIGKGTYADENEEGSGQVEAALTAAVPYAALRTSRTRLWGAVGRGSGEIAMKTPTGEALETDISWTMAALGLRGDVLAPPDKSSGAALALISDAMWARTASDAASGLASSKAHVTRLRLGLEGSYRIALADDGHLTPMLEIGARHDGGDAEAGFGVEAGGGIEWSDPGLGLTLDLSGRTLLAHGNDDLKDRGVAASLGFDPDPGTERGPSMTLSQDWGGSARGGLDALFTPAPLDERTGGDAASRWTAEAAWGFPAFGGRFTASPHVGLSLATDARDYTLGWRWTPAPGAPDLSVGLEAVRRESGADAPEHAVGIEVRASW